MAAHVQVSDLAEGVTLLFIANKGQLAIGHDFCARLKHDAHKYLAQVKKVSLRLLDCFQLICTCAAVPGLAYIW